MIPGARPENFRPNPRALAFSRCIKTNRAAFQILLVEIPAPFHLFHLETLVLTESGTGGQSKTEGIGAEIIDYLLRIDDRLRAGTCSFFCHIYQAPDHESALPQRVLLS